MGSSAQGGRVDINEDRCTRGPGDSGMGRTCGSFKQQDSRLGHPCRYQPRSVR